MHGTWQYEEYSRNKGEDGALRPDVSDVADDEGREDEEQGDHGEGSGGPDHFWNKKEDYGREEEQERKCLWMKRIYLRMLRIIDWCQNPFKLIILADTWKIFTPF